VQVAELRAIQRTKVLDIDDNTYPIISHYRDFSLEQYETYPHSSEQCVAYQNNVAMCNISNHRSISKQCGNVAHKIQDWYAQTDIEKYTM
jgi:hypothetical protein